MRTLTDHIVPGDLKVHLKIHVLDEPGADGTCHRYAIDYYNKNEHHLHDVLLNFQDGPTDSAGFNGITDEALLAILIDRLSHSNRYTATVHLEEALMWLLKK